MIALIGIASEYQDGTMKIAVLRLSLGSVLAVLVLTLATAGSTAPLAHGEPVHPRIAVSAGGPITVTSSLDSGPGTLRQALLDAGPGATITFDTSVFQPSQPTTILLATELPPLDRGDLTLDASNAGVALEGSGLTDPGANGLTITSARNVVRGLEITGFPNSGIELRIGGHDNVIGGDRNAGNGPVGQGNMLHGNGSHGLSILASHNTVRDNVASDNNGFGIGLADGTHNVLDGNYVGTSASGTTAWSNRLQGIFLQGASHNQLVDNVISANGADGVSLCAASQHNTLSDNVVGVDASGSSPMANTNNGISLREGASHNVIGPGNVIAHNRWSGVEVYGSDCRGNTITQNSIHDNEWLGIDLWGGGNGSIDPPVILSFDRYAGTAAGLGYSGGTVEIYSCHDEEGRVLEGQAVCDGGGAFTLTRGSPFAGPHLTAVATDGAGNSSEFSVPTVGEGGSLLMQRANDFPMARLPTLPSPDLRDNRVASFWHSLWAYQPLSELLAEATTMGVKRFRLAINSGDHDKVDWSKPESSVDPTHDEFVTELAENGIEMTYYLTFWDKATYPGGVGYPCPRFQTEAEIQRYLDFVRFIVRHFKDRVQTYEIWNEPDVPVCAQHLEVEDYLQLVRRAVPVILEEYPEARIQVGGTTGLSNPDSRAYLFAILESDVMPLVDVVSWHPFYGESPEVLPEYYYAYPEIVEDIKDTASAHGFAGDYEADEMSWRSSTDLSHDRPWSYPETVCAKYYAREDVRHLGTDVTAGNLRIPHTYAASTAAVRSVATLMAGAQPADVPLSIQTTVTNVVSYGFSLSGGARMVALWTDGLAVEAAPSVTATLRLHNPYPDHRMVAVDPLYGLQEKMISHIEAGDLIVPDLVVKDYPLILRLYVPKYIFLPIVLRE
jgi:parallel beta-helix repeat protein